MIVAKQMFRDFYCEFAQLVNIASKVHNDTQPAQKIPQNEQRYNGMYILLKYIFNMKALIIVKMINIKNGNGTGSEEIALTTLNEQTPSYSVYKDLQVRHFRSEHN